MKKSVLRPGVRIEGCLVGLVLGKRGVENVLP